MRLIDADMGREKLQEIYNAWNLAMAPAEGREIAYVDKKMRLCELMIKFLDQLPTIPPTPNDPLTLEQLREMDGEPVWCESEHRPDGSGWFLVDASALQPHEFIAIGRERGIPCAGIDTGYWLAYRRKPEEGTA